MGKTLLVLLGGLAVAAGSAFAYRDDLQPWARTHLPGPVAHAITAALDASQSAIGQHSSGAAKAPEGRRADASPDEAKGGAAKDGKRGGGGAPAPVTAAIAQLADMPIILTAPGTVEAMATVNIKPRVDGQVVEVGFNEGDLVLEGSTLFRLDDRLVRAQIRQAEATIAKDQAALKDAESILERREALLNKKIASEASTETARQQVEVLRASIAASTALLEAQKTQLDYLTIRAPITGRTGSMTAKLGAFVRSADPNPLVTINQTKPIAVAFALPQVSLDALKRALLAKSPAEISVPGTTPIKATGTLGFVDNQVDKQTGTVTAKVHVENADEVLWPGQAVGIELTVEVRKGMIAVPASAVQPAQQGMITWVINAENRVSVRTVSVERTIGQTTYLSDGLRPGEKVVTDGQLRLAPGGVVVERDQRGAPAAGGKGVEGRGKGSEAKGKADSKGEARGKGQEKGSVDGVRAPAAEAGKAERRG